MRSGRVVSCLTEDIFCSCCGSSAWYRHLSSGRGSTKWSKQQCSKSDGSAAREALWNKYKQGDGIPDNMQSYASFLEACIEKRALSEGMWVHKKIVECKWESDLYLGGNVVRFYASHGKMVEARDVFAKMRRHNTYSWACLIRGYVDVGEAREALTLFQQMISMGIRAHAVLFVYLLRACANLRDLVEGKGLHSHIVEHGLQSNLFVGSALIDMYAKCNSMKDAHEAFDALAERDVVTWTAMISGHALNDSWEEAIKIYVKMQEEDVKPNHVTFACTLRACASLSALKMGRQVHGDIVRLKVENNLTVQNCLVDMYGKCGSMDDARRVFEFMPMRDVVSWNAMICGYLKSGNGWKSIDLYNRMEKEGVEPDETTFACIAKACASVSALEEGKQLHSHVISRGLESNVMVGTALMDMHSKCGSIERAQQVFKGLPKRDVVSWNAMITSCVQHGRGQAAIELYEQMQYEMMEAGEDTFACVLKACSDLHLLEKGREIHNRVMGSGMDQNPLVGNSLIYMYARCGSLKEARKVFDEMRERDALSWYSMIAGYKQHSCPQEAIQLYEKMQDVKVKPNSRILTSVLNACADSACLQVGQRVHSDIRRFQLQANLSITNALVDMYAKCGDVDNARLVFDEMPVRDVVSWSTIISGYTASGLAKHAIFLYEQMRAENFLPNEMTFSSVLKACAGLASLEQGKKVHADILKSGLELDVFLRTGLVHMYSRCGSISNARKEFEKMPKRSVVSWNAMIAAYAHQGLADEAARLFERMQQEGLQPNMTLWIYCKKREGAPVF